MKKIKTDVKLKNVAEPKETFTKFLSNFTKLSRRDNAFYSLGDRNVDYAFLAGMAKKAGVKKIPSKVELDALL